MKNLTIGDSAEGLSNAAQKLYEIIEKIWAPNILNVTTKKGEAEIIKAISEKIANDIKNGKEPNENDMFLLVNFKKQLKEMKNCKRVVELASTKISEKANVNNVDEDWFSFFFDKVRLVSDEAMQEVWSNILSNEVNEPGKYQRSLLHILSIINYETANDFCNLLRFSFYDINDYDIIHPFIFISKNRNTYKNSNITIEKLMLLHQLGLIQYDHKDEFVFLDRKHLRIGNKNIDVIGDSTNEGKIKVGNVILTPDGQALASIVGPEYKKYRAETCNYILEKLKKRNCTIYINNRLLCEGK